VEVNAKKLQSTGDKVQMVEDFRKITDASGLNIYMYGWLFIQIEQFIFLQSHFYFAAAIAMLVPSCTRSVTAAAAASGTHGGPQFCPAKSPYRPASSSCRATLGSRAPNTA